MALTHILNYLRNITIESGLFPEKAMLQNGTRQYTFSPIFPTINKMGKSDYNIFYEENMFVSQNCFQSLYHLQFFKG